MIAGEWERFGVWYGFCWIFCVHMCYFYSHILNLEDGKETKNNRFDREMNIHMEAVPLRKMNTKRKKQRCEENDEIEKDAEVAEVSRSRKGNFGMRIRYFLYYNISSLYCKLYTIPTTTTKLYSRIRAMVTWIPNHIEIWFVKKKLYNSSSNLNEYFLDSRLPEKFVGMQKIEMEYPILCSLKYYSSANTPFYTFIYI